MWKRTTDEVKRGIKAQGVKAPSKTALIAPLLKPNKPNKVFATNQGGASYRPTSLPSTTLKLKMNVKQMSQFGSKSSIAQHTS